jgi:hypothetical protein
MSSIQNHKLAIYPLSKMERKKLTEKLGDNVLKNLVDFE